MEKTEFTISVLRPGIAEHFAPLAGESVSVWGLKIRVEREPGAIRLLLEGGGPVVVTLWCNPGFSEPFPLLPGFMFGDNRPQDTGPGYPQLADTMDLNPPVLKSPYWGIRADRATAPVAMLFGREGFRALAVRPYHGETASGLRVHKARGIGVSLGHIVEPALFVEGGEIAPGTVGFFNLAGHYECKVSFFEGTSPDRRNQAAVIKALYAKHHEAAPRGEGIHRTVKLLADALRDDILIPSQTTEFAATKGELFKIKDGARARALVEIGWTGGSMAAYPFLTLQSRYKVPELERYALARLDRIAAGINPQTGFFYDGQGKDGPGSYGLRGWWCWSDVAKEAHYSYTQGHACYYLLRSGPLAPAHRQQWQAAAAKVLGRLLEHQMENGQFPVSFEREAGRPLRTVGFAGCWFVPALALLYEATKEKRWLEAAIRAAVSYHRDIALLTPCATPMDTANAVDQEGNLALLHGASLLHRLTGEDRFLEMLKDSADYEMLWRYYYNTRPLIRPLIGADWGSSGGSVTSMHNSHIHPMQLNSLDQVLYLHDHLRDGDYYLERTRDAVRYGCCCVARKSENFGWAKPGWLNERFCPSDGLLRQEDTETGEPLSINEDYHPWTVSVTLEGFTSSVWDRLPELA